MIAGAGIANKMVTNIDVLRARVLDVVLDVIERGLGVGVDDNWSRYIDFEGTEEFGEEDSFFRGVGESHIFGFHCR